MNKTKAGWISVMLFIFGIGLMACSNGGSSSTGGGSAPTPTPTPAPLPSSGSGVMNGVWNGQGWLQRPDGSKMGVTFEMSLTQNSSNLSGSNYWKNENGETITRSLTGSIYETSVIINEFDSACGRSITWGGTVNTNSIPYNMTLNVSIPGTAKCGSFIGTITFFKK